MKFIRALPLILILGVQAFAVDLETCRKTMDGFHKENHYRVTRSADMQNVQGRSLTEAVSALAEDELWIDNGAGIAQPESDQIALFQKGQVRHLPLMLAIGVSKPKAKYSTDDGAPTFEKVMKLNADLNQYPDHFKYVESTFEDLDFSKIPSFAKPAKLITSYYGGASYTLDFNYFFSKSFNSLALGGEFWIKDSRDYTRIYTRSGKVLNLVNWLAKNVNGIRSFPETNLLLSDEDQAIFTKIDTHNSFRPLYMIDSRPNSPPDRLLTEINPAVASPGTLLAIRKAFISRELKEPNLNTEQTLFVKTERGVESAVLSDKVPGSLLRLRMKRFFESEISNFDSRAPSFSIGEENEFFERGTEFTGSKKLDLITDAEYLLSRKWTNELLYQGYLENTVNRLALSLARGGHAAIGPFNFEQAKFLRAFLRQHPELQFKEKIVGSTDAIDLIFSNRPEKSLYAFVITHL